MSKKFKLKITKQKNNKSCKEYSYMFKSFINGNLTEKEDLEFVKHVYACKSCMEDLKEYYMFATAFHYLESNDDDTLLPTDVSVLLENVLEREQENRRRIKLIVIMMVISAAIIAFLVSILLKGFWWL